MFNLALTSIRARKLRMLLTSFAVVLGVAFVSGAFFLTDSIRSSFDTLFTEASQGIDVTIQTVELKELVTERATSQPGSVSIDVSRVGVPESVVQQVQQVPGVEVAAGTVFDLGAQPLNKDGEPIGGQGPPSFAAGWVEKADETGVLRIVKGSAPDRDEVMLDEKTADDNDFSVGDEVRILIQGGRKVEDFTVSGIVRFGSQATLNGATISVFQIEQAQDLLDYGDRYTSVDVAGDETVKPQILKQRIQQLLGAKYDVITGDEFSQEQTEAIDRSFLSILQNIILAFAGVAVFVGAFTIFNTFNILVGQRTREIGLLRSIGARRAQILALVVLEALVVGLVASTIGIGAGFLLAEVLRTLLDSFGASLPDGPFELRLRTVITAYLVGTLVTVIASVVPAFRASRQSPLEALRAVSTTTKNTSKFTVALGLLLMLAGVASIIVGFTGSANASTSETLIWIAVGFGLGIIGLAMLSRFFIVPVIRALAYPLKWFRTVDLAERNIRRAPARTAATASALMIGLTLASLVLVFQSSLLASIDDQLTKALGADITVYNIGAEGGQVALVSDKLVSTIADTDGVESVSGQRFGGATVGKSFDPSSTPLVIGLDDNALGDDGAIRITMEQGDSSIESSDLLVSDTIAREKNISVNDEIPFSFSTNTTETFTVTGIYEANQLVGGDYVISAETFDRLQPAQLRGAQLVFVQVAEDANIGSTLAAVKKGLGESRSFLKIQDTEELQEDFREQLAPVLEMVLGMLSLSLIIAAVGIANTLSLSVFERIQEIGLMRAVGALRLQMSTIISVEAMLLSLFGALLGVLVGTAAGATIVSQLRDEGFIFAIDVLPLVLVLLAGLFVGLLASLIPAYRAARTNVLDAITHD